MPTDLEQLEAEVAEKQQELQDARTAPMSPGEATEMARSDPHRFNERWDACRRAGKNPIAPSTKED